MYCTNHCCAVYMYGLTVCILLYILYIGGAAGQLEYAAAGGGGGFNPAATTGYNDQNEFLDSRAEAKRASAERMQHLRQVY